MAINRYSTPTEVRFDDIDLFSPNAQALAQSLTQQQGSYDNFNSNIDAMNLNALSKDFEKADTIRTMLSNSSDEAANTFIEKGVNEGNRFLKKRLRDIKRDFSPGGAANAIQSSYDKYNEYEKQLTELTNKQVINPEKKKHLLTMARNRYAGIGDGEQGYNTFSGIDAVEDINIAERAMELFGQWEEEHINNGTLNKVGDGMYLNNITNEKVSRKELMKNHNIVAHDPKVQAYINQEREILEEYYDYTPEQAKEEMNRIYNNAINAAADAKGYNRTKAQFFVNHDRLEAIKHKHAKEQIHYKWEKDNAVPEIGFRTTINPKSAIGSTVPEILSKSKELDDGINGLFTGLGESLGRFREAFEDVAKQHVGEDNIYNPEVFTPEKAHELWKSGAFSELEKLGGKYTLGWKTFNNTMTQIEHMMDTKVMADAAIAKIEPQLEKTLTTEEYEAYKNRPVIPLNNAFYELSKDPRLGPLMNKFGEEGFVELITSANPSHFHFKSTIKDVFDKYNITEDDYRKGRDVSIDPEHILNTIRANILRSSDPEVRALYETDGNRGFDDGWVSKITSANDKIEDAKIELDGVVPTDLAVDITNVLPVSRSVDQTSMQTSLRNMVKNPANFRLIGDNMDDEEAKNQFMADVESGKIEMSDPMITKGSYSPDGAPYLVLQYRHTDADDDSKIKNGQIVVPTSNMPAFQEHINSSGNQALSKIQKLIASGVTNTPVTFPSLGGEYTVTVNGQKEGVAIQRWIDGDRIQEDIMTIPEAVDKIALMYEYQKLQKQSGLHPDTIEYIYTKGEELGIDPNNPKESNAFDHFADDMIAEGRATLSQLRVLYGDELILTD